MLIITAEPMAMIVKGRSQRLLSVVFSCNVNGNLEVYSEWKYL